MAPGRLVPSENILKYPSRQHGKAGKRQKTLLQKALTLGSTLLYENALLHENGHPDEIIELQLAHARHDQVATAYDSSTRLQERKEMMQLWADSWIFWRKAMQPTRYPNKQPYNHPGANIMSYHNSPSKSLLATITERIVSTASPKRVILFGYAAEKRMGRDSDIDLLVVMPDGTHRRNTTKNIYRQLSGMGFSKDIVVVRESDVENYKDNPSMVIHPAITNGRELYHAA